MPAEDILIDFQVDYSQLDNALATLEKTGTIDSKIAGSFKQTTAAVKGTTTQTKDLVQTFKDVKGAATIMGTSVKKAFDAGVNDALKQAGVSTKEFEEDLKKAATAPASLRQELKNLTQAIAEAKVNGTDLGAEFQAMRKRAGELKDAIADANTEISNAGSDTRGIDNVIGSVSALAGGFAVAQGAAALFGEENEDLQKALLKVNAALAISQGVQQVSNALQKEGSLTKLADVTATGFQVAAQKIYTLVTGQATAATTAFKVALAATGIGAVILLITALVEVFNTLSEDADKATTSMDEFNLSIDRIQSNLSTEVEAIRFNTQRLIQYAKQRGATEEEQNQIKLKGDKFVTESYTKFADKQIEKIKEVAKQYGITIKGTIKSAEDAQEIIEKLENIKVAPFFAKADDKQKEALENTLNNFKTIQENFKEIQKINNEDELASEEVKTKKLEDIRKKSEENRKKAIEEAKLERARVLQDDLAALQRQLLEVEKNSQAEVDIQKRIIAQKAKIELSAEKLKVNQIGLINEQALKDQLDLQTEFNKKLSEDAINAQIETNNGLLQNLNITNNEKLRLTLENLNSAAELEIQNAKDNGAKIFEIQQKLFADSQAARKATLEQNLEEEISLNTVRIAAGRRALERIISDEKKAAEERIAAIKSIENAEVNELDKRLASLKTEHEQALISEEEFTKKFEELLDRRSIIIENANDRIKGVNDKAKKDDDERWAFTTQNAIDTANQVADFFGQLNALSADQENQRIAGQKKQLQQLIDAGAITKKDAEIRGKQIEIQEQQLRQRQAQRDKQLALFNAIINTAAAITKALPNIPLVAIAAAIGAAQIALIAARPIPKFAKGKKGNYSGPGEVGEAGQELVEHGGRMFLTTKPTVMYLGPKDKVFTPKETRQMLHNTDKVPVINNNQSMKIDYDKLAQSLAKNQKPPVLVDFHKDYISDQVAQGLSKNNYFVNRYRI